MMALVGAGLYVGFGLFLPSVLPLPIFDLELTRFGSFLLPLVSFLKVHAKGNCGWWHQSRKPKTTVLTGNASHDTAADTAYFLFLVVSNLNAQLTALHAALPPRTAFLLFFGTRLPVLRKRMSAHCCGVARLTERSRQRLHRRGWDCCSSTSNS